MSNLKTNSKKNSAPQKQKQSKYMTSLEFKEINDCLDPEFVFINFKKKMAECYDWVYDNFNNPIGHLRYRFENEKLIKHAAMLRFYETNDFKWIFPKALDMSGRWWKVKLFMDMSTGDVDKLDKNFRRALNWLDDAESDIKTDFISKVASRIKEGEDFKYAIGYNGRNVRGLDGDTYIRDEYYELFRPFRLDFCDNQEYLQVEDTVTPRETLEAGYPVNFSHYVYENADFRTREISDLPSFKKLESSDYTLWHHMPVHLKSLGLDYTDAFNLKF